MATSAVLVVAYVYQYIYIYVCIWCDICSSGHVWIKLCNVCAHCIQVGARNNQLCRNIDSLIVGAMHTDHYITSDKSALPAPLACGLAIVNVSLLWSY